MATPGWSSLTGCPRWRRCRTRTRWLQVPPAVSVLLRLRRRLSASSGPRSIKASLLVSSTGSHNSQVQVWKCQLNYRGLEPLFSVPLVSVEPGNTDWHEKRRVHVVKPFFFPLSNICLRFLPARVHQQSEVFQLGSVPGGRSWTRAQVNSSRLFP